MARLSGHACRALRRHRGEGEEVVDKNVFIDAAALARVVGAMREPLWPCSSGCHQTCTETSSPTWFPGARAP